MQIKIEKGVPLPPKAKSKARREALRESLSQMKVGDCITVPADIIKRQTYYDAALRLGIVITVQTVREHGKEKHRIWRTE